LVSAVTNGNAESDFVGETGTGATVDWAGNAVDCDSLNLTLGIAVGAASSFASTTPFAFFLRLDAFSVQPYFRKIPNASALACLAVSSATFFL